MSEIPSPQLLRDIRPDHPDSDRPLTYSNLSGAAVEHEHWDTARARQVWEATPNTLKEEDAARRLAIANLGRTAHKAVSATSPEQHDLWAERFTQASSELYGEPDAEEARKLICAEQQWLVGLRDRDDIDQTEVNFILAFYSSVVGEPVSGREDEDNHEIETGTLLEEIAETIKEKYQPLFDLVTAAEKEMLAPEDLKDIFGSACLWLAEHDNPAWAEWVIVEENDAIFSVDATRKEITIGRLRAPTTAQAAQSLLAHELLVHALRGVNGGVTENGLMAEGVPGYTEFEEGLATFTGQAFGGKLTPGPRNHYINIALALGLIDGQPRGRSELLAVGHAKAKLREQEKSAYDPTNNSVERTAYAGVNRIFRGGRGDAVGEKQAVFTKDTVYHEGYKKAVDYIRQQRANGVSMRDIYGYLLLGKFDPTNQAHRSLVPLSPSPFGCYNKHKPGT